MAAQSRGSSSDPPGLVWNGRWGSWSDEGVRVLAACVGVFEISVPNGAALPANELAAIFKQARNELGEQLQVACADLEDVHLASVHWTYVQPDRGSLDVARRGGPWRGLSAALLGDRPGCDRAMAAWMQPQPMCGENAFVVCLTVLDTASELHRHAVAERLASISGDLGAEPALGLELPAKWLGVEPAAASQSPCCDFVSPGNHWFRFCEAFGEVLCVERIPVESSSVSGRLTIVVRFHKAEAAKMMYEALSERYLVVPWATCDCELAFPTLMDVRELMDRLMAGWRVLDVEPLFVLRRCRASAAAAPSFEVDGSPEEIHITSADPTVVIGREPPPGGVCLPLPQISKSHAVLAAERLPEQLAAWKLTIEDASTNGTWRNGSKLERGRPVALTSGDQIRFLPIGEVEYEVVQHPADLSISVIAEGASQARGRKRALSAIDERSRRREVNEWLSMIDNGRLMQYEARLLELCGSLADVTERYANNIRGFIDDLAIADPGHQRSFRRAIMRLRDNKTG